MDLSISEVGDFRVDTLSDQVTLFEGSLLDLEGRQIKSGKTSET